MRSQLRTAVSTPILLFQMGKVGSSALHRTLTHHHRGSVIHAHRWADLWLRDRAVLTCRRWLRRPILVICPVRDPLSRNVSAFFQNFQRDTGRHLNERDWSVAELRDLFLEHYPHHVPLTWFDEHFRPTFGIDVLAEPFPIAQKWRTYDSGSMRVLIYRSDLPHHNQLAVISDFVGQKIESWLYDNVSAAKSYARLYERFCAEAVLPERYIERTCTSRFSRHFWNESEIEAHADKWRRRDHATLLSG